jgi:signal transduction histidine kinase
MHIPHGWLLFLWLFLASPNHAQSLPSTVHRYNPVPVVEVLEDPSKQLDIDRVQHMGAQFKPLRISGSELNFGYSDSAWWVRIPLQREASAPKDWLLEVHYTRLDSVGFYAPGLPAVITGSRLPLSSRPIQDSFFVFPVQMDTQLAHAYLRVTSEYAVSVPLTLWQPQDFWRSRLRYERLQFVYFGMLTALVLLSLVVYAAQRDRRFTAYAGYVLFTGLGVFAGNGFGRQLLWSDSPSFEEVAQILFFSFSLALAVLFARWLLLVGREGSWVSRSLRVSQWMFVLTALLCLLHLLDLPILRITNLMLACNAMVMALLVSWGCVMAWQQRREGIRFFLAGWLVLSAGVLVAAMRALGWVPSTPLTSYAVQISTGLEMLLMAVALGDLLRLDHRAHSQAQAKALATQNALLALSQSSEDKLKRAVHERTAELETSLQNETTLREQYMRFGAMISHEFRTPLSIIQTQASLMRKEREHQMDNAPQRLDAIHSATERLRYLFEQWLQKDRLQKSLPAMQPQVLALHPWLQALVKDQAHLLTQHPLQWQLHPHAVQVLADPQHLAIAVTNLIDNASKYAPAGSTITVKTICTAPDALVGIAICDQGPGVAPQDQTRVFSEYWRHDPESAVRGVGLGLSIVQRIAQANGGSVTLTSSPGQGATFCIWLPPQL